MRSEEQSVKKIATRYSYKTIGMCLLCTFVSPHGGSPFSPKYLRTHLACIRKISLPSSPSTGATPDNAVGMGVRACGEGQDAEGAPGAGGVGVRHEPGRLVRGRPVHRKGARGLSTGDARGEGSIGVKGASRSTKLLRLHPPILPPPFLKKSGSFQ